MAPGQGISVFPGTEGQQGKEEVAMSLTGKNCGVLRWGERASIPRTPTINVDEKFKHLRRESTM